MLLMLLGHQLSWFRFLTLKPSDEMQFSFLLQDVQLTASNDDQYFVFEDMLYQVRLNIDIF